MKKSGISKKIGQALRLFLSLGLGWQCSFEHILPDPSKVAGLVDINHYANLRLWDWGNVGDLDGLGDWSDKGNAGGRGVELSFLNWAKEALTLWQIGLENNSVQRGRQGFRNWITVAQEDCIAEGVPQSVYGRSCGLKAGVVGICYYAYNESAQIIESTVIVEKNFLKSEDPEKNKIGVFTHEIGHCLGLRHPQSSCPSRSHSGTEGCVMHPIINQIEYLSESPGSPAREEIEAVQEAYGNGMIRRAERPLGAQANRFSQCLGQYCYQPSFPVFHISASIGQGAQWNEEREVPENKPEEKPLRHRVYIMRDDGSEEIRMIHPDGSIETRTEKVEL